MWVRSCFLARSWPRCMPTRTGAARLVTSPAAGAVGAGDPVPCPHCPHGRARGGRPQLAPPVLFACETDAPCGGGTRHREDTHTRGAGRAERWRRSRGGWALGWAGCVGGGSGSGGSVGTRDGGMLVWVWPLGSGSLDRAAARSSAARPEHVMRATKIVSGSHLVKKNTQCRGPDCGLRLRGKYTDFQLH